MTEEQTQRVFKILSDSGQIERYKFPVFSPNTHTLIVGLVIGTFGGFLWGFSLAIYLF
jgi:hypothetical protein